MVADGRFIRRRGRPRTSAVAPRRQLGRDAAGDERAYQWATEVLFEVRKQRSEAKQPLKVPITKVIVTAGSGSS